METQAFYRFVDSDNASDGRPFTGLLAFIPQPESNPKQQGPKHAAFANGDLQWLEIKDRITSPKLYLELLADSPRHWLVFQLAGSSEVYLPHAIRQSEGRCLGFGSKRQKIAMALAKGNVWLLLVACKSEALPRLAEEFEQLAALRSLVDDDGPMDVILVEQPIDYAQRRRLQALEKMVYKPFGTPVLLSEWLLRTLPHLGKPAPTTASGQITLYHDALRYIREHYLEDITINSIAQALHVSVRTLNRTFENRPVKINDFIHKLKLNKARELLYTTDRPIEEIARELNFSCPKYFSNRYKQHFFESPTAFRLQYSPPEK